MYKYASTFFAAAVLWVATAYSATYQGTYETYPEAKQQYVHASIFSGDSYGEFKGDFVAHLADGSAWKVHPDSVEAFGEWFPGDTVHAEIRNSFYWFKREHKFKLVNEDAGNSVKVMLVKHKKDPLVVANTDTMIVSFRNDFYTTKDENGVVRIVHYQIPIYNKIVLLSDGTLWRVKTNLDEITLGKKVYVGANDKSSSFSFFFITGTERSAIYTKAYPESMFGY